MHRNDPVMQDGIALPAAAGQVRRQDNGIEPDFAGCEWWAQDNAVNYRASKVTGAPVRDLHDIAQPQYRRHLDAIISDKRDPCVN